MSKLHFPPIFLSIAFQNPVFHQQIIPSKKKKKKKKKIKAVQQILPNKSCVERLILNFKKLGFIKKKKKKKVLGKRQCKELPEHVTELKTRSSEIRVLQFSTSSPNLFVLFISFILVIFTMFV